MKSKKIPYWKHRLHEIVYEADTPAGKRFDLILLILILLSVILVMLESVSSIHSQYEAELNSMEWVITGLFSIEYITRIIAIKKPFSYVFSFYGIIDLLSTLPKYISLFFVGSESLIALRALRLIHFRNPDVSDRRRIQRLYEYSPKYLLGNRNHDNCWLWRYRPTNPLRAAFSLFNYDYGVRNHCSPNWDCIL